MESRLRAANLENSCKSVGTTPTSTALLDTIQSIGAMTAAQASQLRKSIARLDGDTYLINETIRLPEQARRAQEDG